MPPDSDTLARTIAFERELVASVSTRMVSFAGGVAYLNDGYRERWDSNFLWVDGTAERVDAAALAAEADRVLGEAGLLHREIRIDDDAYGHDVAADLARAGYGGDRLVVMEQRRAPDQPTASQGAEEIDLATLRPALEIVLQREPWATSDVDRADVADFRERSNATRVRGSSARASMTGSPRCASYARGSMAQIEDVNTLEEFRNRGLGRAVVQRAADEARNGGAETVFLHALDDDWPKALYAKLGFDAIGYVWSFVRPSAVSVKSPV